MTKSPRRGRANQDVWPNANPPPTRFSRDRPRFNDTLDVIKFLCKDLWQLVFRKQVDNLKTNHRVRFPIPLPRPPIPPRPKLTPRYVQGVYVLTDNAFRPFARMSTETGGQAVARAQPVRCPPPPSSPLTLSPNPQPD